MTRDRASAPLPPLYPRWRFSPMSWAEVEHWIDSYNSWAEIWNIHERSSDLPLSPPWPGAEFGPTFRLPLSALVFRPRGDARIGAIRVVGWREFFGGWSYCRTPADVGSVAWAGWHARRDLTWGAGR